MKHGGLYYLRWSLWRERKNQERRGLKAAFYAVVLILLALLFVASSATSAEPNSTSFPVGPISSNAICPYKKTKVIREFYAQVTAYTAREAETDSFPCVAANGEDVCDLEERGERTCAASLPFGTKLYVPRFGACTVRDRLNKKYSSRIDVFFGSPENLQSARQWGIKRLKIQVIE